MKPMSELILSLLYYRGGSFDRETFLYNPSILTYGKINKFISSWPFNFRLSNRSIKEVFVKIFGV